MVQVRTRGKLKTLYLHHDNAYGKKTYHPSDIRQGAPNYIFA